ncbi:MAG: hypothetical protein AB7S72_01325 [Draconibacterium sp.]
MGHDAIKLEIIEWLAKLEDSDTIEYLKIVKDLKGGEGDWWDELTEDQKQSIERGLNDIEAGRLISHDAVKAKYGL